MSDVINILVAPPPPAIRVTVTDPNDEVINIQVSDVVSGVGGGGVNLNTVLFEGIVNGETVLTGTTNTLTGFDEGSDIITLSDFEGVRVEIQRGSQDTPTIGPYAGFIKDINSDSVLLLSPLIDGEYLKIKTIPPWGGAL